MLLCTRNRMQTTNFKIELVHILDVSNPFLPFGMDPDEGMQQFMKHRHRGCHKLGHRIVW
jgi:hypothetical protein